MKSIIEEASSIEKAIEKGWIRAGKPQEFLIKVLEEPKKGFLGLFTKKSAKVSLYFQERFQQDRSKRPGQFQDKRRPAMQPQRQTSGEREKSPNMQYQQQQRQRQPQQQQAQQNHPHAQQQQSQQPKQAPWTPAMITACKEWINKTLNIMHKTDVPFTIEDKNYYLTVIFSKPLLADTEKTKALYRSYSYLLMQSMRNQFKKSFKGHKIIIRGMGTEEDVRGS